MALMTTVLIPKLIKVIAAAIIALAVVAAHIFIVSVLVELGKSGAINEREDNLWLGSAEAISWKNPDIYEAQARYYRRQAFLVSAGIDKGDIDQAKSLEVSLDYWRKAINASPAWPYYLLGALDIEVLLDMPATAIQSRLDLIIGLAPNERGIDKHLLKIAFVAWRKLSDNQKEFLLERLDNRNRFILQTVFKVAKAAGTHHSICINLPWKKVRKLCQ